jgi:hypothetical protein
MAGVLHHQRADAQHQRGEQPGQSVHAQGHGQAEGFHPGVADPVHLAGKHRRGQQRQHQQAGKRGRQRQPTGVMTRDPWPRGQAGGGEKGQQQQQQ